MPLLQRTTAAAATVLAAFLLASVPVGAHAAASAPASTDGPSVLASCGFYDGSVTTARGAAGPRVAEIQCLINNWSGSQALVVDGVFGPRTESWVVYFQDVNGLAVDGVVGPETWAALRAV